MAEVFETGGAFTIRELTGRGREVRLQGRGLPYRPFSLSTSQRVDITWYPGNPVATGTPTGGEERPTQIQGAWKDKYIQTTSTTVVSNQTAAVLVDGQSVANVRELVGVVNEMVLSGQVIEVTWDNKTRHGYLKQFDEDWDNVHDVRWRMHFVWISRGQGVAPTTAAAETNLSDTAGQLTRSNEELQAASVASFSLAVDAQVDITEAVVAIDASVVEVESTLANLSRLATTPSEAVRRTISLINNIVIKAQDLIAVLTARPALALSGSTGTLSFQATLVASSFSQTLIGAATEMSRVGVERRARLSKQIDSELLGTYQARQGQNLREVSELYYGTVNEWRSLMLFNGLSTPVLNRGQVVLVPKQPVEVC